MCPDVEKSAEIGAKRAAQTAGFVANRQKRRCRVRKWARLASIAPIIGLPGKDRFDLSFA